MSWIRRADGDWQKRPEIKDPYEILRKQNERLKAFLHRKLLKRGIPFTAEEFEHFWRQFDSGGIASISRAKNRPPYL